MKKIVCLLVGFLLAGFSAGCGGGGGGSESGGGTPDPGIVVLVEPTATAGDGTATVSWDAVDGATSYNIYFSDTAGVTTTAYDNIITGATSPTTITGLTNGQTYYFVVTKINGTGEESEESEEISVTVPAVVVYVAFGTSTTWGDGDDYPADDNSLDGRNSGGGFEPILNDLLTAETGKPHSVENEGYGGKKCLYALSILPYILDYYPEATYYLIQWGSNDADPDNIGGAVPDGLGLYSGDVGYDNTYKAYMQEMIDMVEAAGKIPILAKLGYTLDPPRNANIEVYNQVIDELVADNHISVTPPDFYTYFHANQDQLADTYHPNGVGYQEMARLWKDALLPLYDE